MRTSRSRAPQLQPLENRCLLSGFVSLPIVDAVTASAHVTAVLSAANSAIQIADQVNVALSAAPTLVTSSVDVRMEIHDQAQSDPSLLGETSVRLTADLGSGRVRAAVGIDASVTSGQAAAVTTNMEAQAPSSAATTPTLATVPAGVATAVPSISITGAITAATAPQLSSSVTTLPMSLPGQASPIDAPVAGATANGAQLVGAEFTSVSSTSAAADGIAQTLTDTLGPTDAGIARLSVVDAPVANGTDGPVDEWQASAATGTDGAAPEAMAALLSPDAEIAGLGPLGMDSLANLSPYDHFVIDRAVQEALQQLNGLATQLSGMMGQAGWYPWFIGAAVVLASGEWHRRNRRLRSTDDAGDIASLWLPGLEGVR